MFVYTPKTMLISKSLKISDLYIFFLKWRRPVIRSADKIGVASGERRWCLEFDVSHVI